MKPGGVLLVSNLFSAGSHYGGVCVELSEKLIDHGWSTVTTSSLQNRYLRPFDMLKTILLHKDHYQIAQIDVFSWGAFRWAELSAFLLKKLGKPMIFTLHGGDLPNFAAQQPERVQKLLQMADVVTTPSGYLLEHLQAYRSDIQLIPNPIPLENYQFRLRDDVRPQLLYLRALHRMYNPHMAVEVLANISSSHPEAHLTMVGPEKETGLMDEVQERVNRLGCNAQVQITGAIPKRKVPTVMNKADIFINTTNVDNTPISVIEAMATGLCIVSTNVGGIPYLLTHEENALLVPPNDAEAMTNAVQRVLTESGLASHLSQNARRTAESFSWDVVFPQWISLFSNVAR